MPTEAVLIKIEEEDGVAAAMDRAAGELDAAEGELVLEFSTVRRIDAAGLRALEQLVRAAGEKTIKVSLRGVNGSVYKVLKLMKLSQRISFMS